MGNISSYSMWGLFRVQVTDTLIRIECSKDGNLWVNVLVICCHSNAEKLSTVKHQWHTKKYLFSSWLYGVRWLSAGLVHVSVVSCSLARHCLLILTGLAQMSWGWLAIGYDILTVLFLIFQQACSNGYGRGKWARELIYKCYFVPLLASHLVSLYWPKQVSWWNPESDCESTAEEADTGMSKELGPLMQSVYLGYVTKMYLNG